MSIYEEKIKQFTKEQFDLLVGDESYILIEQILCDILYDKKTFHNFNFKHYLADNTSILIVMNDEINIFIDVIDETFTITTKYGDKSKRLLSISGVVFALMLWKKHVINIVDNEDNLFFYEVFFGKEIIQMRQTELLIDDIMTGINGK